MLESAQALRGLLDKQRRLVAAADIDPARKAVDVQTVDLDQLRVEVEANLRRIDALLSDLNRRWPLARDTELRVP